MATLMRSIIKRACEKQASRHKFLHIDVKSRFISAIFFIDETKRTRKEGFELNCLNTVCTLIKIYNDDHYNSLCNCYCLCTATNNLCTLRWHKHRRTRWARKLWVNLIQFYNARISHSCCIYVPEINVYFKQKYLVYYVQIFES